MAQQTIEGTDWTDREIDLIVADYFAMLQKQFAGEPLVKAHHNAALREQTGRSRQSIDYKYRNISAVLEELCEPWLSGFLPARNFQRALVNGVERILDKTKPFDFDRKPQLELADSPIVFLESPPTFTSSADKLPEHVTRLVRKFDPAARDARNRKLGTSGEEMTFHSERARLRSEDREDLARKVRWVSREDGDGAGYDILSFDASGAERFLEVKTTNGHSKTPFYISANEKSFADETRERFRLFRLYEFANQPKAFTITPPLEDHLKLQTATYKAGF